MLRDLNNWNKLRDESEKKATNHWNNNQLKGDANY